MRLTKLNALHNYHDVVVYSLLSFSFFLFHIMKYETDEIECCAQLSRCRCLQTYDYHHTCTLFDKCITLLMFYNNKLTIMKSSLASLLYIYDV